MKDKKHIVLPVALFGIILLLFFLFLPDVSVEDLINHSPSDPLKAVAFVVVLYAFKSLTVFFPLVVLEAATGMLFPMWAAFGVNILGLSVALILPYFLGKAIGLNAIESLTQRYPKFQRIMEKQENNTFFFCYFLRALHCLPGDLITMYMGASNVPFWHNFAAGMLGLIPGMILSTLIGQSIQDPSSPMFWISGILMVSLTVLSTWLYRKRMQKEQSL